MVLTLDELVTTFQRVGSDLWTKIHHTFLWMRGGPHCWVQSD